MANCLAVPINLEALFIPDNKVVFKETKGYSPFLHSKSNSDKKTQGIVSQPYLNNGSAKVIIFTWMERVG